MKDVVDDKRPSRYNFFLPILFMRKKATNGPNKSPIGIRVVNN